MDGRSKKLIRQYKRYLGTKEAENTLLSLAEYIQSEEWTKLSADHADILAKFSDFADAIQDAYAEYEDRLSVAARNIELSSKELTTAFRDLEKLNASINAMLDSLGQGLLFFDENGVCSSTYSKSCTDLLETDPAEKHVTEVLKFSDEEKEFFDSWMNIAFSGNSAMDFDDLRALLPQERVNQNNRIIELDYRPMNTHKGLLSGVLLIATDVTYQKEAEEQILQTQSKAQQVMQIAQNRNGYFGFITDLLSFINTLEKIESIDLDNNELSPLLRSLHTFKGLAGSFHFHYVAEQIHTIENELKKHESIKKYKNMRDDIQTLKMQIEQKVQIGRNLFGPDFMSQNKIQTIEFTKLEHLAQLIETSVKDESVKDKIHSYMLSEILSVSAHDMFDPFRRELERLAEQQGKPIPEFTLIDNGIKINPARYEEFFRVLIHVARNIIDHGIELPETRVSHGKPEQGHITVLMEEKENALHVGISDDGAGINIKALREKLPKAEQQKSDDEILQHIFRIGLSSRTSVSVTSGQGIGLNAVYQALQDMNGTVHVTSDWEHKKGTSFLFKLPTNSGTKICYS